MPKFDSTMFSDVEYDLTGFKSTKTGEPIDDKGVIPEPDRHLVGDTMKRISAVFRTMDTGNKKELDLPEQPTPEQVNAAMNAMDKSDFDKFEAFADELVEVIGDFCQGHPTKESLDELAWPKFMAFFGYVMENMLSPEASTPGSNATPPRLRSA